MSMWEADIEDYSDSRNKDPEKVAGILQRKGWLPAEYDSSMKKSLFAWLDQWYTLSIKNLPAPATARKRNPSSKTYRRVTNLPGGGVNLCVCEMKVILCKGCQ